MGKTPNLDTASKYMAHYWKIKFAVLYNIRSHCTTRSFLYVSVFSKIIKNYWNQAITIFKCPICFKKESDEELECEYYEIIEQRNVKTKTTKVKKHNIRKEASRMKMTDETVEYELENEMFKRMSQIKHSGIQILPRKIKNVIYTLKSCQIYGRFYQSFRNIHLG